MTFLRTTLCVLAAGLAAVTLARALTGSGGPRQPAEADLATGAELYAQHCASCHGARLQGAPNWRTPDTSGRLPAPPHDETGHTWHHGDAMLFTYTRLGGQAALAQRGVAFDSGMPAFGEVLSDRQIWDVLAFIKSTWPERVQEQQAARTQAESTYGEN